MSFLHTQKRILWLCRSCAVIGGPKNCKRRSILFDAWQYHTKMVCKVAMGKKTLSNNDRRRKLELFFSVRKRLMQTLNDKNVPANQMIQTSGHKNVNSINSYSHIISWQAQTLIQKSIKKNNISWFRGNIKCYFNLGQKKYIFSLVATRQNINLFGPLGNSLISYNYYHFNI